MTRDWFAVIAGPLAWFTAHVASWMLVPAAHDSRRIAAPYAFVSAALAVAIVAGILALGRLRALRGSPPAAAAVQRARFLAASGVALSALSIVLVVGLTLPMLLLLPGAEP